MKQVASDHSGMIFNIQRFSLHDGAGFRTIVFLKGCPLRCRWCSNPEGFIKDPQILSKPDRCLSCGACARACREGAVREAPGFPLYREKCVGCGLCAVVCPSGAKSVCGELRTVDDIVGKVLRDRVFYKHSGGGVTVGGGEILSQPGFALAILRRCRENGISAAIETSGCGDWNYLSAISECCDTIHYDLKAVDPVKHRILTGADNALILENLMKLDAKIITMNPMPKLIIRLPIIKNHNDGDDFAEEAAEFLTASLRNYSFVELMPFHNLGESKYRFLDVNYELAGCPNLRKEDVARFAGKLSSRGISVRVADW